MTPVQPPQPTTELPLVTIAIPTFNRAASVRECALAALSQSYPNIEVVVSDNASTDETQAVLATIEDRRLRVIRQATNIGLLPNWNACVDAARGEYFVLVPDDDRIAPWMVERCVALTRMAAGLPVVISLNDFFSSVTGQRSSSPPCRKYTTGIWPGTDLLVEYLKGGIVAVICTVMVRTDALRSAGGFPLDFPFAADTATWTPLLIEGQAGLVNEACGTFHIHGASETSRLRTDQILEDNRRLAKRIADAAGRIGDIQKRRTIVDETERFVARRVIDTLSWYRSGGATLAEVLPILWKWRSYLAHLRISDLAASVRQLALLLLPKPVADRTIRIAKSLLARSPVGG